MSVRRFDRGSRGVPRQSEVVSVVLWSAVISLNLLV